MTPAALTDRAQHIADVRALEGADAPAIRSAMVAVRQITAWADAQNAALIGQLSAVDSFPEMSIAEVSKGSLSDAAKIKERADTLEAAPSIAGALESGSITAGHVDAVTRGSNRLEPSQREEFVERAESLVGVAAAGSIDEFARRLNLEIKQMQSDDGEKLLIRQRRDARLSSWTDNDGMWNLRGRFDPVTGIRLAGRIDNTVQTLAAEHTPELCPSDPIEKSKFLAAHALDRLLGRDAVPDVGGSSWPAISPVDIGRRTGRAEFVAVIDADAPATCDCGATTTATSVDWRIPVEVPPRVLAELAAEADVIGVVVRNGVVLHAPGEMNLGRGTRLASRDQRRSLRGLYRGCAVPGCPVGFDRCKIHHVIWWRHGGRTDLDNLLPVCSKHHSRLHADGWLLELGPHRESSRSPCLTVGSCRPGLRDATPPECGTRNGPNPRPKGLRHITYAGDPMQLEASARRGAAGGLVVVEQLVCVEPFAFASTTHERPDHGGELGCDAPADDRHLPRAGRAIAEGDVQHRAGVEGDVERRKEPPRLDLRRNCDQHGARHQPDGGPPRGESLPRHRHDRTRYLSCQQAGAGVGSVPNRRLSSPRLSSLGVSALGLRQHLRAGW